MSYICIIYAELLVCYSVVVSGAGSGMCELTNQRRPGIQEGVVVLERQELKQSVSKEEDSAAAVDSIRKQMSLSTEANLWWTRK